MRTKTLTPSISIVIPAYNEEQHLRECLESIKAQSIAPSEVIVVDNNSTDLTARMASSYDFVKVVSEKKQGISHAHHTGFAAARSVLIARIDADSVLPNDWVERVLGFYASSQNMEVVLTGSGYFKNLRAPRLHTKLTDSLFIATRLLLGHHSAWGPNLVIPKESWQKIASETCQEKPTTYDDFDIALHLRKHNIPIVWQRSLRVGARMRHLNNPYKFWHYIMRWPGTLRHHADARWVIAWFGCLVCFILEYPILFVLQKRATT